MPNTNTLMLLCFKMLFPLLALTALVCSQNIFPPSCSEKEFAQQLQRLHPEIKKRHDAQEGLLYLQHSQRLKHISEASRARNNPVVLPIVIHIIHNNGQENISDAQFKQGIKFQTY